MSNKPFHSIGIKQVFSQTHSSGAGLTFAEAKRRQARFGANELDSDSGVNIFSIFLHQFSSPLVYVLVIAAIIAYFLGELIDSLVIGGILIINALIGVFQEWRAELSLNELKKYIIQNASVFRDGKLVEIESSNIVVGDVIKLSEGAAVPADIRLFKTKNLKIDESILTGESVPHRKSTGVIAANAPILKRANMIFAGTNIVSGSGLGVVVATSHNTEFGRLAVATTQTSRTSTPLNDKINYLGRFLLIAIAIIAIVISIIGIAQGRDSVEVLFTSVALAVAAIPEGLPVAVTVALAIGVSRMAKKNAITRKLSAIETLGVVNTIVSDKTGTLTENKLTVKDFYLPDGSKISFEGIGYNPRGLALYNGKPLSKNLLSLSQDIFTKSVLVNDSQLKKSSSEWQIIGDPTEGALLVAAKKLDLDPAQIRQYNPRIDEIPFSSELKLMATANQADDGQIVISIKGNIERVLSVCNKYLVDADSSKAISQKFITEEIKKAKQAAKNGYRLIAFASLKSTQGKKLYAKSLKGATYLGFVAMIDAPRQSAISQVRAVQNSGIRVIMVTGDFKETAVAVAKMIGINGGTNEAFSEAELLKMDEHEFSKAVASSNIFAEISPQIKLKIVKELEALGGVIAVTGDGANDAPILKRSAVGIAVGIGGTDIARASADIVLADNNFSTIVNAIKEGRLIFENIRRSIWYLVSTNVAEISVIVITLILGAPLPLAATQILWINVITDGTGTIALALEKAIHNFLKNPPRPRKEFLINSQMIKQMALVSLSMTAIALFFFFTSLPDGLEKARTMAFVSLALLQIFNLFNARELTKSIFKIPAFSNGFLWISAILSFVLVLFSTQLPFFQHIFETTTLSFSEWLMVLASSFSIIIIMELYKAIAFSTKK